MKQTKRMTFFLLTSMLASTGVYNPCLAKPAICKAYDYAKRTVLITAPYLLANLTEKYVLEKYGRDDAFYQDEKFKYFIFGAYAAYFWPKALHQKLK